MQDRKKPRAKRPFLTVYYNHQNKEVHRSACAYLSTAIGSAARRLALRPKYKAAEVLRRTDERVLLSFGRPFKHAQQVRWDAVGNKYFMKEIRDGR